MNRHLPKSIGRILNKWGEFAVLCATLALLVQACGCASRRPVPVLVAPQTSPIFAKCADNGTSLKVVTYNIWGLPSWMTGAPGGRYPRIARELERLDPEIILLQEAWTAKAQKAAPANGRWAIARAAGQHTFFQQSGLETLSRFPIIGGEFYPFSRAAFPDRFVNKGVLKVTVRLPDDSVLNIWNVHLQDGGPPEVRLTQVRELEARVRAAEDGQIADLVGGDFNCTPESGFYHELESEFGPSVQGLAGMHPFVTWDGMSAKPSGGKTLDYIFVRGRTALPHLHTPPQKIFAASDRKERLSDHFGIEVVMNLNTASPEARPGSLLAQARPLREGAGSTRIAAASLPAATLVQSGIGSEIGKPEWLDLLWVVKGSGSGNAGTPPRVDENP